MKVIRDGPLPDAAAPAIVSATAFTNWVRPWLMDMWRFAARLVGEASADDVVQEALSAAWRSRHKFDSGQGDGRAWLLAIVANKARDQHRTKARHASNDASGEPGDPDGGSRDVGTRVDVDSAMRRLTVRQRSVVALFYYLDLPVSECAQVMGCSVGTVKSTLSDARARLGTILGNDYT